MAVLLKIENLAENITKNLSQKLQGYFAPTRNKKQEKIKINFVVNRRYNIFNMFTESNYFVNFCLNVLPPPSTVSIFCECAEHKNSEFYSFYINVQ